MSSRKAFPPPPDKKPDCWMGDLNAPPVRVVAYCDQENSLAFGHAYPVVKALSSAHLEEDIPRTFAYLATDLVVFDPPPGEQPVKEFKTKDEILSGAEANKLMNLPEQPKAQRVKITVRMPVLVKGKDSHYYPGEITAVPATGTKYGKRKFTVKFFGDRFKHGDGNNVKLVPIDYLRPLYKGQALKLSYTGGVLLSFYPCPHSSSSYKPLPNLPKLFWKDESANTTAQGPATAATSAVPTASASTAAQALPSTASVPLTAPSAPAAGLTAASTALSGSSSTAGSGPSGPAPAMTAPPSQAVAPPAAPQAPSRPKTAGRKAQPKKPGRKAQAKTAMPNKSTPKAQAKSQRPASSPSKQTVPSTSKPMAKKADADGEIDDESGEREERPRKQRKTTAPSGT